ncbi:aldehyde dehydrogenase, partial [Candidatus Woesearchaeota archaeon CG10_big_fil_rev_8_21_14_0_10_34_8]
MKTYKLYIDGKYISSSTKETFVSVNPANPKDILAKFHKANASDVEKAVRSAEKAFVKWSVIPAPKRGEILLRAAELLRKEKKKLGKLVTREMGKQILEGLADVQEAIDVAEYMAAEGRRMFGYTTPSELRDKFCMTI